jgi:tRNA uridine 5-carboxymethylaminomethyl modification enzyme
MNKYNCIVVGGGHAGVEAAHIVAKAGFRVLLISMNLDEIGQMSCNPAIGGIAKGHIVREIDALGGIMGLAIDHTGIHYKMLNRSKGSAMWSPRAQADKHLYKNFIKFYLEQTADLDIIQDTVASLQTSGEKVTGVITERGGVYFSDHVILTTGTFLRGIIHIGSRSSEGGRTGAKSANNLSPWLESAGFEMSRLKTGTPPRIHSDSIDYARIEKQMPDEIPQPFSFQYEYSEKTPGIRPVDCYVTYTTDETKKIVTDNLDKSAMYGGFISSVGPRYCPSIEDKVVRFADKERHQLFLEPEGLTTKEVYVNGISTSLPEDVQIKMVHSITGLEKARIMRPGYAIEYDYAQPTQLFPWLETKKIKGLFFAGQINGTTGYEEAAGQGLLAGLNVVYRLKEWEPLVLGRDEAYLGVLVDDLVTKGVEEPYRMFTSRAEYRLHLRQDNADLRLMKYVFRAGINQENYHKMAEKYEKFSSVEKWLDKTKLDDSMVEYLKARQTEAQKGTSLKNVFKRPQVPVDICIQMMDSFGNELADGLIMEVKRELKTGEKINLVNSIKYEGYVKREKDNVKRKQESLDKKIPENFRYEKVPGLKTEARQKLMKIQPVTLGQAARISGVDPSDVDILFIFLESQKKARGKSI